ncbi:MAG: putative RNA-binding protein with PIN domain [Chlamydiales bacterium]|jgi:predicted RNA-binding protein with PIN domain
MHYFIDGYNLLLRFSTDDHSFQSDREQFISDLNETAKFLNLDITIVFDAAYTTNDLSRSHFDSVELIFTGESETADDYILDALQLLDNPRKELVVTSDKGLARRCRSLGAHTQSVHDFINWISNRNQKKSSKKQNQSKQKHLPPSSQKINKTQKPLNDEPLLRSVEFLPPVKDGAAYTERFQYYLEIFEKRFRDNTQEDK